MFKIQDRLFQSRYRDRGAILVLLALAAVPILILLAIVVDLSMLASAKIDLERKTNGAALSALAQYSAVFQSSTNSCTGCESAGTLCHIGCSAIAAQLRAQEIAGNNVTLGERFSSNRNDKIDSFMLLDPLQNDPGDLVEGAINVGKYYWVMPSGCPGRAGCPPSVPYFEPKHRYSDQVNAVRLRTRFKRANLINAVFASILGINSETVDAQAIAALLPRNDFFLVDLSRSMYRENYLKLEVVGSDGAEIMGSSSEFIVGLKPARSCPTWGYPVYREPCCNGDGCVNTGGMFPYDTSPDPNCLIMTGGRGSTYREDSYIVTGQGYSYDHQQFDRLRGSLPIGVSTYLELPVDQRHFSREYKCVYVDIFGTGRATYLADFGDSTAGIPPQMKARPEPLFSVLDAANRGLTLLAQRAVSVDKTGLIGFDSTPIDVMRPSTRVMLPMTQPSSSNPAFTPFVSGTSTDPVIAGSDQGFLGRGLFPIPGTFSDIFEPLRLAAYQISLQPTYVVAKNSIVIFTDGLQNCLYTHAGTDWLNGWTSGSCLNNGVTVTQGIATLGNANFVNEFARRSISVSVVLIGKEVGQHYVLRRNAAGTGCVDQIEDAASGGVQSGFVNSNWGHYIDLLASDPTTLNNEFRQASRDTPFYAPNELYETIVKPTKGLWVPLLPAWKVSNGTEQKGVEFFDKMHQACANAPSLANLVLTNVPDPFGRAGVTHTVGPVTDAQGRLLYDPLGQSSADQLKRAMDVIIQSPYTLVR